MIFYNVQLICLDQSKLQLDMSNSNSMILLSAQLTVEIRPFLPGLIEFQRRAVFASTPNGCCWLTNGLWGVCSFIKIELTSAGVWLSLAKVKNKGIFIAMRWNGGVQGYSIEKFNPYVLGARSNSQPLLKFINFGFLGLDHNLSITTKTTKTLRRKWSLTLKT